GEGKVGWFGVRVKDADRAAEVASAIDREFANSPYETKSEPEGAFAQGFVQQMGNIGTILISILSAVFFTILLVAGNSMAQALGVVAGIIPAIQAMRLQTAVALGRHE